MDSSIERDYLESFRNWLGERAYSDDTVRSYTSRIRGFLNFAPSTLVKSSLAADADRYLNYCHGTLGLSKKSIRNIATALDAYILFITGVQTRSGKRRDLWSDDNALSESEVVSLRNKLSSRPAKVRTLILLMLLDRLRISECVDLDVDDVLLSDDGICIKIPASPVRGSYLLSLSPDTATALLEWLRIRSNLLGNSEVRALFVNRSGTRLSRGGIDALIRAIGQASHVDVSARVLYSSGGTW